jgi:hypothetical protein
MARKTLTGPITHIPPAPTKAKRERPWDRDHKNIVSYRGIDPDVIAEVKSLADTLGVPVGEVAQALFEHALEAHKDGDLALRPQLKTGKFTLFGKNGK